MRAIRTSRITICLGPAGSGKTMIAAYFAATALKTGQVERIICVRPAVEAANSPGKNTLGYLPGSKDDKLNPYMKPLLTQLKKFFSEAEMRRLRSGELPVIELYPLEHLRGETLENCFVIFDEAQNATMEQFWMFLTRLGEGTCFVINGDITQCDLPLEMQGALKHYSQMLADPPIDAIAVVSMTAADVVRDPLIAAMMHRRDYIERSA
jgi:phosphate starvation-inducible PhoH-like protein